MSRRDWRRVEAESRRHVELYNRIAPPIRAKIVTTLLRESRLNKRAAEEAAFHLTDWIVDLRELNALFKKKRWGPVHARKVLMGFVIHAPWHLAAAHRILCREPVIDVFQLGAVLGDGIPKRKPGGPYPEQRKRSRRRPARPPT